jgi:hypothetical protein
MRQYYEPALLKRVLDCDLTAGSEGTDSCDKEFKPLPPISSINRVRARVTASGK